LAGPPLALQPGELTKRAPPSRSAYFLDVDGTLLEIKPSPEDVVSDKVLRALLTELAAAMGGALGLVSGRTIGDLDRIFAPLIFPAVGLHGAEIRFPDGARKTPPLGAMDAVRESLMDFVVTHPGLRLEDKGAALAVHFRQAPDLAGEVLKFVDALAKNSGLALQPGKMVAELKQAHHDKGRGIATLLASAPFAGRKPVFIGDDLTDETGFLFVNVQGGISVRAGPAGAPTHARYLLRDPANVRAELHRLLPSQEAGPHP
jgi:trehalose 6-phosphate phosphatase